MEGMLRVRPLIARRFARGRRQPPQVPPQAAAGFGVNLVGYFQAETGVGESVRGARAALRAAGVPVQPHCVCDETVHGSGERLGCYGTNVFYVNADQTRNVGRCLGESFYRDRHNVGFWVWELDEFPDQWIGALSSYQEIWTPSTFCRDAVARKSPLPVTRIPYAVEPIAPRQMGREVFGLPRDRFVFLFAFDVLSVMERKNPIGVIRAFEKAFPEGGNCELVIKVNHADAKPECIAALQQACSSPNVRIVTAPFSREEVYGLIQCCDCVVSLHRSEGFGLLMAEAMYFGKPVIATNYSGNTDFTLAGNAMLVDYRLIPVGDGCAPYPPQAQWADPDLSHAARHMQEIVASSSLRERLQSAGRDYVAANLSYEAVGRLMRERLTAVRSGNAR